MTYHETFIILDFKIFKGIFFFLCYKRFYFYIKIKIRGISKINTNLCIFKLFIFYIKWLKKKRRKITQNGGLGRTITKKGGIF